MATVFEAFPQAVISDDWKLGLVEESTDVGKIFVDKGFVSVIVDEAAVGLLNNSPSADGIDSDTLIYAKPSELPGLNVGRYIASYYWYQVSSGQYYEILEVGIGKNQQENAIEHVEFRIRPVEVAFDGSDS